MIESVNEKGYAETTVADVIGGAGVSRATFYEHFEDKEACFLEAYGAVMGRMLGAVASAFQDSDPDLTALERMRMAISALFDYIATNPVAARVGIVEAFGAGSEARARYQEAVSAFFPFIDSLRELSDDPDRIPAGTARLVVGGISAQIYRMASSGEADRLGEALPEAVYLATVPYVGHERALEAMEATPVTLVGADPGATGS